MTRRDEVRQLLTLDPGEVVERAGDRLEVCEDLDALHRRFAELVFDDIQTAARAHTLCRLILPVGPTGGYEPLAERINASSAALDHCRFFFMDEYCDENGHAVDVSHPLSFKGVMRDLFFRRLDSMAALADAPDEAGVNVADAGSGPAQVWFPDQDNIDKLAGEIRENGGIDTCYGGIGIHGHVAFNEPEPGVADSGPRKVRLNDFTVTINAARAEVGGNLECFPREAYTLGMRQILESRRIVLFCRNGTDFDWANTVLRLALFGEPGDDYPVTHIRDHTYLIVTDRETLSRPRTQL